MPQHHVSHPRGSDQAPRSFQLTGRFGRLFRNLPPLTLEGNRDEVDAVLKQLADRMVEPTEEQGGGDWKPSGTSLDSDIPAGYTYLGQFIDHDITFDPVSSLQRANDPDGLTNFRTPRFDLDSLYGAGPHNDPFMYDPDLDGGGTRLLVGRNDNDEDDLPRNILMPHPKSGPRGRALIGDPRNDENIIVSQLHLLFLKFHNKVLERVRSEQPGLAPDILFEETQRVVRWHYQWIVVKDFLPRIVGKEVVDNILAPGADAHVVNRDGTALDIHRDAIKLKFFKWRRDPFMPVEFSVAAYRFGHSMIRPTYKINGPVPLLPIFSPNKNPGQFDAFHGFRPLPPNWTVDWDFFFESPDMSNMQVARKIDAHLALGTFTLPELPPMENLAHRNLRRGHALELPSGQSVARVMAVDPLTDDELGIVDLSPQFTGRAPLWFYLLREADLQGGGKLGPVGGRIVAEVLIGLLKGDHQSFINVDPNWHPTLGQDQSFTMRDLVDFVDQ